MKSLYLLDGMALAYRAHFALIRSPIYTSAGFNTSAIFGFTATLIELIQNRQPSHLAVVFDTSAPTERHRIHPHYKANREAMPEDLAAAMPHLDRVAAAFGIPVLKLDGYEADDIIGTLAHRAEADGFDEIFMVTPDKDFGQLVTARVHMYRPGRKGDGAEIWGVEEIKEKWGIQRVEQVIDMLGLCGDSVDNIPGVPGIGPKTAVKMLAQYDSVEGLLEHVDELKGKQQEKVRAHAEQARMSKQLATIQLDVPIELDWASVQLHAPDPDKIVPLFAEFEFRNLGKRIFGSDFSVQQAANDLVSSARMPAERHRIPRRPDPVRSTGPDSTGPVQATRRLHGALPHRRYHGKPARTARRTQRIQQFCLRHRNHRLEPPAGGAGGHLFQLQRTQRMVGTCQRPALEALRPVFANDALTKIGHNLKFDLAVLAENDCPVAGACYDTLLAHGLIEPEQGHKLDNLAEDFWATPPSASASSCRTPAKPTDRLLRGGSAALADYAIEDADVALQLWQVFAPNWRPVAKPGFFMTSRPLCSRTRLHGARGHPAVHRHPGRHWRRTERTNT